LSLPIQPTDPLLTDTTGVVACVAAGAAADVADTTGVADVTGWLLRVLVAADAPHPASAWEAMPKIAVARATRLFIMPDPFPERGCGFWAEVQLACLEQLTFHHLSMHEVSERFR